MAKYTESVIASINDMAGYEPVPLNRYVATVTRPSGLDSALARTLQLRCESAELPGKNHPTSDARLYGPIRKIPYNMSFVDTTFTFMCSQKYLEEKRYFDQWQDLIVDPNDFDVEYYDKLIGEINLKILNENSPTKILYEVDFQEVFPLNVGAISVGFGTNTDYMKLSVTFSFRTWKRKSNEFEQRINTDRQSNIFDFNELTPIA